MARAGGSQRQKVLSEQLWGVGAGSSLPSSGIHSLSSTTYRQRWQETNSPGKQVAGGMGLELRYKKGENPLVHEASGSLRDSQQVEWWAKNRWHRRKRKRINKLCGQIPPAEKRACKKLDGIQANRSHRLTSPREIWWGFPGGSDGKEYACDVGDLDLIPRSGRSPGEGMATRSRILAWRIPGTEESVGYNPWGCKSHDWVSNKEISSLFSLPHPVLWPLVSKWPIPVLCGHWLPPVNGQRLEPVTVFRVYDPPSRITALLWWKGLVQLNEPRGAEPSKMDRS